MKQPMTAMVRSRVQGHTKSTQRLFKSSRTTRDGRSLYRPPPRSARPPVGPFAARWCTRRAALLPAPTTSLQPQIRGTYARGTSAATPRAHFAVPAFVHQSSAYLPDRPISLPPNHNWAIAQPSSRMYVRLSLCDADDHALPIRPDWGEDFNCPPALCDYARVHRWRRRTHARDSMSNRRRVCPTAVVVLFAIVSVTSRATAMATAMALCRIDTEPSGLLVDLYGHAAYLHHQSRNSSTPTAASRSPIGHIAIFHQLASRRHAQTFSKPPHRRPSSRSNPSGAEMTAEL